LSSIQTEERPFMKEYWNLWTPTLIETFHLTCLEDGVYRRLINLYMETETGAYCNTRSTRIDGLAFGRVRADHKHDTGILQARQWFIGA
jgi:hypothetical protein